MKRLVLAFALVFLGGCTLLDAPKHDGRELVHPLDEKWRPLEDIRERPVVVQDWGSPTAITTVGRHAYVLDLKDWLDRHPSGVRFDAVIRHEQEHSRRQLEMGTWLWIARYSYDKSFAWAEEQIGYYYQIKMLKDAGQVINVDGLAAAIAGYKNLAGQIVEFEKARAWIREVLAGRWTPDS